MRDAGKALGCTISGLKGLGRGDDERVMLLKIAGLGAVGFVITAIFSLTFYLGLAYGLFWVVDSFGVLKALGVTP